MKKNCCMMQDGDYIEINGKISTDKLMMASMNYSCPMHPEVTSDNQVNALILRLSDLYFSISNGEEVFYIIISDRREKDVVQQLNRPVIKSSKMNIKYILFSELSANCDAICKFGLDHSIMEKIAKTI